MGGERNFLKDFFEIREGPNPVGIEELFWKKIRWGLGGVLKGGVFFCMKEREREIKEKKKSGKLEASGGGGEKLIIIYFVFLD